MKFDVNVLRYLSKDEFRVLTAVEMGMKNHEIVPTELVERIAGLKHGGAFKNVKTLLRHKLVHHDASKYDGYRLTTLGYDFLAIKTFVNRGVIVGVGRQIGVGKESDIFEVVAEDGTVLVLKLHRLGRTSFRAVKTKRDYLRHRNSFNWLYLSRLAALKEYAFMKALSEHGFPVPRAVEWNRHCVLMTLVPGYPLVQVKELENPGIILETVIGLIVRLAQHGLIHCDFNEFNIMIDNDEKVTMIDFPQMVSVSHRNAEMYFDRDVECIFKFFSKRFAFSPSKDSCLQSGILSALVSESELDDDGRPIFYAISNSAGSLDKVLAASGFTHQHQRELEEYAGNDSGSNNTTDEDSESDIYGCSEQGNGNEIVNLSVSNGTEANDIVEGRTSMILDAVEASGDVQNISECSDIHDPNHSDDVNVVEPARSPDESSVQHSKRLEKQRIRAIASVRGGNRIHTSRNFLKDKGGRRAYNSKLSSKIDF